MCTILLIPLFVLYTAIWAPVVAYKRRAKDRVRILIYALAVPTLIGIFVMVPRLIQGNRTLPDWMYDADIFAVFVVYPFMSLSVLEWARHNRSEKPPRGFPIEPINSVAPNDSDRV
jgi:NADH:ubiquinone oxidoreductase subunit 6 (subunit J)